MADFSRAAFIGIGLINGSMALAMRARGFEGTIRACARKPETRAQALRLGLCDEAVESPADAVRDADLVVIGVPPGSVGAVSQAMAPGLDPAAIVTDVSSIKGEIIRAVVPHLPNPGRFVAGHPVAGTEHSGPEAAFATLFEGRRCILTPVEDTDADAVARIRRLWESLGSIVDEMSPEHHDQVLAITSHVPHLIAYTIVSTVAELEDQAQTEVFKYAAGGFTDFTRIAASDPVMWRDVFLENRGAVLEMLGRFTEDLTRMQRAIRFGDGESLQELFTRTRAIRRGVVAAGQAYDRQPTAAQSTSASPAGEND